MYYEDQDRATGRTFRLLLNALLEASKGKKIHVLAHSPHYAKDLFQRAMVMGGHNARQDAYLTMRIGEGMIVFSGPIKTPERKRSLEAHGFTFYSDHYMGY